MPPETIISSSTHRLDDEQDLILGSIMDGFIEGGNEICHPPSSIEQMEALILSIATGFIDQHKVEVKKDDLLATLQIFENSINELVSKFSLATCISFPEEGLIF
jgi:hypothetical protein